MIRRALLALFLLIAADASADRRFGKSDQAQRFQRDRVTDVEHLRLDVRVDVRAGTIAGTSTIDLTLLRDATTIALDAANMTIHTVKLGEQDLRFEHREHSLRIDLPVGAKAGRKLALVIAYEASPRRGLYFVRPDDAYPDRPLQAWTQGEAEDNRFWFPGYDYPDDRFSSEVLATVREPFKAVSNGKLVGTKPAENGWNTFHWKQAGQHVNYLVTLVIGEYVRHEIVGHRVPMAAWVYPSHAEDWKRSFVKTVDIMAFFEEWLGQPYPWEKYDQIVVHDFLFGGMENTSVSTLTANTIHDARAALDWSSHPLVAHELAHQWFGDLLTCRSWSHLWLNEGFATYFEMLYLEARQGKDEFELDRMHSTGWYMDAGYRRRMDERRYDHPDDLFDGHTYVKGAWILHMLRVRFGDAAFQRAVRHYVTARRDQPVESIDLRRAFEDATGGQLQAFFDQWVHRPGHPQLQVSSRWDREGKLIRVSLEQQTRRAWQVPLRIHAQGEFGERSWVVDARSKRQEFAFALPSRPAFVEVDRNADLLAEIDVDKPVSEWIAQLAQGGTALSRRRAARGMSEVGDGRERDQAVAALVAALSKAGEFRGVKSACAQTLGGLGGAQARTALVAALGDSEASVRGAAADALAGFEGEAVTDALEAAFEDDRSYKVAASALVSYARIRRSRAMSLIRDGLKRDSHREVIRKAAIDALVDIGGRKAFDRVVKQTRYGRPTYARRHATEALGTMGADARLREPARKRLEELLADKRFWVRHDAVEALGALGDPAAIPAVERLRKRASTRRMARAAAGALRGLKEREKRAEQPLKDTVEELRRRVEKLEDQRP